jgi:hypothetical protein
VRLVAFVVVGLALLAPAAARAQVSEVATALRADPVYVDPDAELASQVNAADLRSEIAASDAAPLYIAVLPASDVEGSAGRTLIALRQAVGQKGTYALAVGNEFRTLSDFYNGAGAAGDAAHSAHPEDLQATLKAFIDTTATKRKKSGSSGGAAGLIALAILILVAGAGATLLITRRRARAHDGKADAREPDQQEEFVRLGDGIRTLELDVSLGDSGREDYDRAVAAYDRANDLNARGDTHGANRALEEGLRAIATARERIAGRR